MHRLLFSLHMGISLSAIAAPEFAFPESAGFGAFSKGGKGGQVIQVTRLDDDLKHPPEGSFRWAVLQKGPRIVKFQVAGTILLQDEVEIREPFITIDGGDAQGMGVCLRGGSLEFTDTHDIIVRNIRLRLGDETTKRKNREQNLKRPEHSNALDCIGLTRCKDAIIDHVSTSWSCDELFSVVHCQNVTVQWCILAEPLSNPELHPYGDNHAFCFNSSADTLSVHHCLFARYVMRGPQFEANDMRKGDDYGVQMEAVNNVMFDYQKSGSRYTTGIEDHKDEATAKGYAFQFIGNVYLGDPKRPAIEAVMKHGVHAGVSAFVDDSQQVKLSDTKGRENLMPDALKQLHEQPIFTSPAPIPPQSAAEVLRSVLDSAGCSHARDAVDQRVITSVREKKFQAVVHSQEEVGGWPQLTE
ncbi:hypothetical protein [Prosthecobacter sp.]|uniref:hypothetical protein n=1 Tax=Prosthecobacter sp. TaxID=1965333 RepID=UPI00248A26BD|nr:hypothetical protein [Prosthecobacter sp.]MDI1315577.1 hypothetical protein [Prosthecobacter sp.]